MVQNPVAELFRPSTLSFMPSLYGIMVLKAELKTMNIILAYEFDFQVGQWDEVQ